MDFSKMLEIPKDIAGYEASAVGIQTMDTMRIFHEQNLGCDQETLGFMAAKIGEHMITPATGRG